MDVACYPLISYLREGISANEAIKLLKQNNCLSFPQLRSGLFPAAIFENLEKDETGMANAWLRDSACIGTILLRVGEKDIAARAARGVINKLNEVHQSFEDTIQAGLAPSDDKKRPPVRYANPDSIPRYDWVNAQNDALGYSLQFIGACSDAGLVDLAVEDITAIDMVVSYLAAVRYWQDDESGHWEEVKKVNASSIGTVVGGLEAIRLKASNEYLVDSLITKGRESLQAILPDESITPGRERKNDSALIFLIEPQGVVSGRLAEQIIRNAMQNLMGEHGFRRYNGDSYWGPDYRKHFLVADRAADFSNTEDMAIRNKYVFPGGEAQWTFIDPLVSSYYSRKYKETGKQADAQLARHFIARSLNNIIAYKNNETKEETWRIPELFFFEEGHWVPNDHLGLLWGQANLLYGLTVYQEVLGDSLITLGSFTAR